MPSPAEAGPGEAELNRQMKETTQFIVSLLQLTPMRVSLQSQKLNSISLHRLSVLADVWKPLCVRGERFYG